ncbi:MAG: hypothetical protein AABZ33_07830 [Chloroflexota bacterium]
MTRRARSSRRGRPAFLAILLDAGFLSAVGLAILAVGTLSLLGGALPFGAGGGGGDNGGPARTPAPSNVVVVDPRTKVPGSIAYVKSGNIWIQSGASARQLTNGGKDATPSWSPDGEWIYFIRTVEEDARYPWQGESSRYLLTYPLLMRVGLASAAVPEELASGRFTTKQGAWFYWLRQPAVSPDGTTLAIMSDGPDPTKRNVVLQFFDLATGALTVSEAKETAPLGHQDPAWRPSGGLLLFVRNDRDRTRGAPSIQRYDVSTGKTSALTGPGYVAPSWSPDERFVAATRVTSFGTDVVILDAATGVELLRLTSDERSFAPAWSPAGDAIAYFHVAHGIVDLRMVPLVGAGPDWTAGDALNLTEVSGLDAASRPSWFIPADELPAPTPSPTPLATPAPAGSDAVPVSPVP